MTTLKIKELIEKGNYLFINHYDRKAYIRSSLWASDEPIYLDSYEQGLNAVKELDLKYEDYYSNTFLSVYEFQNFSITFVSGQSKWINEELIKTESHYVITKGGEWHGEGNFCGWYSNEYLTDVEVYGILDEKYNVIEIYDKPKTVEKLNIYSYMWGGNTQSKSIEDIKNKIWV